MGLLFFLKGVIKKTPPLFPPPATKGGTMKTEDEIKQTLTVCILRKLKTMTIEELREINSQCGEICDRKKPATQ